MEEMSKIGKVGQAAMKAGMDRKTGRRYIAAGKLPSEMRQPRWWRTRPDAFAEDWPAVAKLLAETPGLEAQTVLELLEAKQPGRYNESHLRTLQRRIRRWRAEHGPEREIWFTQAHRPGEAAQTDFTSTAELGVTIVGQLFVHLLCVTVLPYSNWQWATACLSESLAALRRGIQSALFQLGRVPRFHQTDHSTAATHQIARDAQERTFNDEYVAIMRHLGMEPRTIAVGAKEQNGDVEASNGALKRRLEQALLVRGSRDFADQDEYERFVAKVVGRANAARGPRVVEEIEAMRPLVVERLPEYTEMAAPVASTSTIRVKSCAYSVPSRLIGARVRVRVFEHRIEVYYADKLELACKRLRGKTARIDYRHVIWSLVRKPGAFSRYVYRDELFPSVTFRRAYDAIQVTKPGLKGDVEYLRILHLAASTMEADVEQALAALLAAGTVLTADATKMKCTQGTDGHYPPSVPALEAPMVDLATYDLLLEQVAS
jgi:transposase InsO family protein